MSDNFFADTNVLVYSYTEDEPDKRAKALKALSVEQPVFISTQVMTELSNVLKKKFSFSWKDIATVLPEVNKNFKVHTNSYATLCYACALADKYQLPFYDSLIVASALECNCTILYSEDLQDGQVFEKTLKVLNPFK